MIIQQRVTNHPIGRERERERERPMKGRREKYGSAFTSNEPTSPIPRQPTDDEKKKKMELAFPPLVTKESRNVLSARQTEGER